MNQNLRKILLFMLQFVPWFLLFLVLYLVLLPKYEPIVLASANVVTENMTPPTEIEQWRGRWRAHVFTPDIGRRTLRIWNRHASHLMLLSLVTLPALLLATPAPFLVRLRMLGLALPLLFLGHVVSVIGLTRADPSEGLSERLLNPSRLVWSNHEATSAAVAGRTGSAER